MAESQSINVALSNNDVEKRLHDQPETVEQEQEDWNQPRSNILRVASAYYGFIVFGMNDSALGVLVPHLETYYDIDYLIVSLAFLTPFAGYLLAATTAEHLHRYIGRRGISCLGTSLQLLSYVVAITKPKYYGFLIVLAIGGFGSGCIEASWNSWIGGLKHVNQLMGLLHACYGLGGVICPTIFTAIMATGRQWNVCYALMIAFSVVSVILSTIAFRKDSPKKYHDSVGQHNEPSIISTAKHPVVWMLSFVLFCYVGGEVTFGGWLTTFMIEIRKGDINKMGYVSTGYWGGLTIGRVVLGFVTGYIRKEELLNSVYMASAIGLILLIWLPPNLYTSAVFAALFGVAIGPIFPTVVVVAVKRLPKRLHVSGIGFAAAFSGIGAAMFPFINGVVSNKYGPTTLPPLIVGLFGAMLIVWAIIWMMGKSKKIAIDES